MTEQKLLNKLLNAFGALTGFHTVIQSDHNYIHQGLGFTTFIETGTISANYYIGFKTPSVEDGKFIHWRPAGIQTSSNYVTVKLYEGDAFTVGTASPIQNRNRNLDSTKISTMQIFNKGVTSTPVGDLIQLAGIGTAGNPASRTGGGAGANEELVLLPDSDYVIEISPAGATLVTLSLFWYEEDSGYIE